MEIDGCTRRNAVGDAGTLGLLQMVNHSCTPNCRVVPAQTFSGIELLILEALVDIADEEEITIDSATLKQCGLTFWQWQPPSSPAAEGLLRIQCGCAGAGRVCPNRLWRDEHDTRPSNLLSGVEPVSCLTALTADARHLARKRSIGDRDESLLVRSGKRATAHRSEQSTPTATTMEECAADVH